MSTWVVALLAATTVVWSVDVRAQTPARGRRVLSLDEALTLGEATSEQVTIAQAGIARAEGNEERTRSEMRPQLSATASYDRTIDSEFRGLFDAAPGPSCDPLSVNPAASLGDRVAELERAYGCQPAGDPFGGGGDELPFGRENAYRFNLAFSQLLYSGGRVQAQQQQADITRQNATIGLSTTRAQLVLDIARAFYDAALSDRLVSIAEASLAQADRTYQQTRALREAGRLSEFDLLRAQVARDTLRPSLIQNQAQREIAHFRLKQLLELPLDTELELTARLDDERLLPEPRFAARLAEAEAASASAARAAVTQVANEIGIREAAIDIVRSQRRPSISVNSAYGRVGYETYPWYPRTNWTVGASVSMPILTGGRIRAEEVSARADLDETRARVKLAQELAWLDEASTRRDLTAARAAWEATAGTIEQAERAYEIAELRYREGISTQLELSDARLLLQQALANRAVAARDLQVSRVRLALLPDLPLSATTAGAQAQQAQAVSRQQTTGSAVPTGQGAQPGAATTGGTTTRSPGVQQ